MLWYKSWLDTRWRFLAGFAILMIAAAGVVLVYPNVVRLLPLATAAGDSGLLGRQIQQAAELQRDYAGYIWSQWFRQNLPQLGTLLAVILGTGGLLAQLSRGAVFTLALPVSRTQLMTTRAATGLAELAALVLVPSLLIPLLSPAVGETYPVADAVVYGVCMFIGSAVFFSLALLLSTMFADIWRPPLLALCAAFVVGTVQRTLGDQLPPALWHVMSGELYFRRGGVPWMGLLASAAISAVLLYGAARNTARQDF